MGMAPRPSPAQRVRARLCPSYRTRGNDSGSRVPHVGWAKRSVPIFARLTRTFPTNRIFRHTRWARRQGHRPPNGCGFAFAHPTEPRVNDPGSRVPHVGWAKRSVAIVAFAFIRACLSPMSPLYLPITEEIPTPFATNFSTFPTATISPFPFKPRPFCRTHVFSKHRR